MPISTRFVSLLNLHLLYVEFFQKVSLCDIYIYKYEFDYQAMN